MPIDEETPVGTIAPRRTRSAPSPLEQARRFVEGVLGYAVGPVVVLRSAKGPLGEKSAVAATQGRVVHVSAPAVPAGSAVELSVLVHELVHVAQQRHAGFALPAEASVGGRDLEAAARQAEWRLGHPGGAPGEPAGRRRGGPRIDGALGPGRGRRAASPVVRPAPPSDPAAMDLAVVRPPTAVPEDGGSGGAGPVWRAPAAVRAALRSQAVTRAPAETGSPLGRRPGSLPPAGPLRSGRPMSGAGRPGTGLLGLGRSGSNPLGRVAVGTDVPARGSVGLGRWGASTGAWSPAAPARFPTPAARVPRAGGGRSAGGSGPSALAMRPVAGGAGPKTASGATSPPVQHYGGGRRADIPSASAGSPAAVAGPAGALGGPVDGRAALFADPSALDTLAGRLYPYLRRRLQTDVRRQGERPGRRGEGR